jgi:hypothetical protein
VARRGDLTRSYIWLTSDEAVELTEAIQGRIDWFRGRSDLKIRPDGAGRVQVGFLAVPVTPRPSRRGQS